MSAICHDIYALRAAGASYREIAVLTGLAESTVYARLNDQVAKPRELSGRGQRKCMCCGKVFLSDGPHNRLCDYCRHKSNTPFDTPATVRY